jgi:hypothetical protein
MFVVPTLQLADNLQVLQPIKSKTLKCAALLANKEQGLYSIQCANHPANKEQGHTLCKPFSLLRNGSQCANHSA